MATREDDLLALFADNDTNDITAERLRQFVTDIYYDACIREEDIIDNYDSTAYDTALSSGRGKYLNDRLEIAEATIIALEARIAALE